MPRFTALDHAVTLPVETARVRAVKQSTKRHLPFSPKFQKQKSGLTPSFGSATSPNCWGLERLSLSIA